MILAIAYDLGTENAAERAGHPRTFWTGGALFVKWHLHGLWSVSVRPELYWDRNGRLTGSEQFIKAITTTLECKQVIGLQTARVGLEYRYDESTGVGGGFFKGGDVRPGTPGLAREQHLLLLTLIWSFDS